ncbi:hypothetical protein FY122_04485 [Dictyoglomus thermophilum]|uniref:Uncharacterized protein n=1 Tax=Dictyoglomus thermophilum TaxID=14 RepID=A0A7V4DX95_DICTH|nr:hypothetical protein [Dictyoglomus thermophilum]TYT23475.1 hypothetical protein FY122_04485 [Dictyoglomus thermophilum]
MRKVILFLIIVFLILAVSFRDYWDGVRLKLSLKDLEKKVAKEEKGILKFLRERLIDKRGLIISEIKNSKPSDYSLLESYGELMEYVSLKGDKNTFDILLSILKKYFVSKEGYLYWRVNRVTLKPEKTTALVDSLRILHGLILAYEKFRDERYLESAKFIANGILKYNTFGDKFVDSYDGNIEKRIFRISLFYLDLDKIKKISQYFADFKRYYQSSKNLLENSIKPDLFFFPKEYDYLSQRYIFPKEINMLEQVLTALNMENKLYLEKFIDFVNMELNKNRRIFIRYDLKSNKLSDTEDPTIYFLLLRLYKKFDYRDVENIIHITKRFNLTYGLGDEINKDYFAFTQLEVLLTLGILESGL